MIYWIIFALRIVYIITLVGVSITLRCEAIRTFTHQVKEKDFDYMIFCGLAVNRLWFIGRSYVFENPINKPGEGESLIACYLFAIGLEICVFMSHRWQRQNIRESKDAG